MRRGRASLQDSMMLKWRPRLCVCVCVVGALTSKSEVGNRIERGRNRENSTSKGPVVGETSAQWKAGAMEMCHSFWLSKMRIPFLCSRRPLLY